MSTIYLVTGVTGEYADTTKWNVKAFGSLDQATDFLEEINTVMQNTVGGFPAPYDHVQRENLEKALKDLDPDVSVDYTGIDYEIEEIELEE